MYGMTSRRPNEALTAIDDDLTSLEKELNQVWELNEFFSLKCSSFPNKHEESQKAENKILFAI